MITIKINKRIKIKEYMNNGLKIFVKLQNNKWICLKFNYNEIELLHFVINAIIKK